jgi:azurin
MQPLISLAADKRGLNASSSTFATSSMVQRLAYGPRFSSTLLKTTSWQNANINPEVAMREIVVSGNIRKGSTDYSGLLMAHGNKSNGYAVYFKDGQVYFLINRDGKQYSIRNTQPLPAVFALKASLEKNGRMRLFLDNKEVALINKVPLFTTEFETTLRTALENKSGENRAADFEKEFPFNGSFSNLRLETLAIDKLPTDKIAKIDQTIILKVVKDVMRFDKETLKVKAGSTVQIIFQNPDFMQHNFVLAKPKTLEIVGAAADRLAQDPGGIKLHYVPRIPQVLQATPLVNPGGNHVLTFKVPDAVGDYPYVCTFPGHWRIMKGTMQVRND